jgi:hypothetical protein
LLVRQVNRQIARNDSAVVAERHVRLGPIADIGRLRPMMLDGVPICVQYDVGGAEFFCADDLHHRQKNGRYKNYFFKRLQRRSS